MSDDLLTPNSKIRFWPEMSYNTGFLAAKRMFDHWDTYVAWCLARNVGVFEPQSPDQPSIDDINRAITKYAESQGAEPDDPGFQLWYNGIDTAPWIGDWWFPGLYTIGFDWPITEDDHPNEFASAYKMGFMVWIGYRVMLAQQVWRCFHYTARPGAGNFVNHPEREFIFPGHPDYPVDP